MAKKQFYAPVIHHPLWIFTEECQRAFYEDIWVRFLNGQHKIASYEKNLRGSRGRKHCGSVVMVTVLTVRVSQCATRIQQCQVTFTCCEKICWRICRCGLIKKKMMIIIMMIFFPHLYTVIKWTKKLSFLGQRWHQRLIETWIYESYIPFNLFLHPCAPFAIVQGAICTHMARAHTHYGAF